MAYVMDTSKVKKMSDKERLKELHKAFELDEDMMKKRLASTKIFDVNKGSEFTE